MEDLKVIKCKTCGEVLDTRTAKDGVIECRYCSTIYTLPKPETPPEAVMFIRMGEHDLDICNWDGAIEAFRKACEKSKGEPEAYWGMALASYKVQYLKDVVNNRLQPICHEISTRKFSDSKNYQLALKYATPAQKEEYEKKAAEIDYIKEEFLKLSKSGVGYDSFICVKVTAEGGGKTEDYKDAEYIYDMLKEKGYSPFFSERSIRNRTGADYEAMILYALYSAETMLVVCRNEEYLQTCWVKNEYTRFLRLVNDEEKESDSITFVYYEKPIERLPGRSGKLQGIDFSRRGADGRIIDFVDKHTPAARARREEARRRKAEEAEAQARRIKELEERLQKLDATPSSPMGGFSMEEMFARFKEMERQKAEEDTRKRAEEEARKRAEEEARRQKELEEEEARRKAEEEERRRAEEEAEAEEQEYDDSQSDDSSPEFVIENGVLKKYSGKGGRVVLPSSVKSIGSDAFFNCESITAITIPASVKSIGDSSFYGCSKLTAITIERGLRTIGNWAFSCCSELKKIVIPGGVTSIGTRAFACCNNLVDITIPASVTSLGKNAFYDCESLSEDSLKQIEQAEGRKGSSEADSAAAAAAEEEARKKAEEEAKRAEEDRISAAFASECEIEKGVLKKYNGKGGRVVIPASIKSIGSDAFFNCESITAITIPASVKSIGDSAFYGCSKLTTITIEKGLRTIGNWAFSCCSELKKIVIPGGVTSIGTRAFACCNNLTNVTIPASVTSLGKNAFYDCESLSADSLKQIEQAEERMKSAGESGTAAAEPEKEEESVAETTSEFEIENGVLKKYNGTGGSVTIPSSVKSIGADAFSNCTALTGITIPRSVTSIGDSSFFGCEGLKSITIPSGVTSIGTYAFYGCSKLTSVTIPGTVREISGGAFSCCGELKRITIPSGVKTIGSRAFSCCNKLTDITIPSSVTSIGDNAFYDCESLSADSLAQIERIQGK